MRINNYTNHLPNNYSTTKQQNNHKKCSQPLKPAFRASAYEVEKMLARKGITCDFGGNSFVADCVKKTVDVFENLFGRSSLPQNINFRYLGDSSYGSYNPYTEEIGINSAFSCFDNIEKLKKSTNSAYHFLRPNDFSSLHPACTFVHEFSHSAHKNNIEKQGRFGPDIMELMRGMQVPTAVGRLITKFKLGKYALDRNGGMNEFMAERATQDICNKLTDSSWVYYGNKKDVKYEDIFSRKWNCRYSTPQAYLDYYTQQVWNGDIRAAEDAAGKIEVYLEEIERKSYNSTHKQNNLRGIFDEVAGKITGQARWLDRINKLKNKY